MGFRLNGVCLGAAFIACPSAHYFPAVSCYMGASVTVTFQPPYRYNPPLADRISTLGPSCCCYAPYTTHTAAVSSFSPSAIQYQHVFVSEYDSGAKNAVEDENVPVASV